jgi:hypothetical protein
MNAADLIKKLVSLGVSIKDIVSKSPHDGPINWAKVLTTITDDPKLSQALKDLLATLTRNNLAEAIDQIDQKQKALLAGREVRELSHDELLQYSDLADARLLLATQQLTQAFDEGVLQWLIKEALPLLIDIAPVVIPLLL